MLASLLLVGSVSAQTKTNPQAKKTRVALKTAKAKEARLLRAYNLRLRALRSCHKLHPGHCRAQGRALAGAGKRLHSARVTVRKLGRKAHTTSVPRSGAPTITVSGHKLTWTARGRTNSYEFVEKIAGLPDYYRQVTGTAMTPAAVPGKTVTFSVRPSSSANAWAHEVKIRYSGTTSKAPPAPTPAPPTASGDFSMGVVAGAAQMYELPFVKSVGAHTARMDFSINTPASQVAPIVAAYAAAGIRPLLLASFGSNLPTTAQAQNLASWAAAIGPGGSYWQGRANPGNNAVTDIEFGNETSYTYQWSDNSTAAIAGRAQTYALRAKDAITAIKAANPSVGLVVIGDNAEKGQTWVQNMFKAVPDLGSRVAGWTIHPYGPDWASRIDDTISSTAAAGAPSSVPIFITEWGISSDNGACLTQNYGWDKCMSYNAESSALQTTLAGMQARYGKRIGAFYLYQVHDQKTAGATNDAEGYFGVEQSNGAAKGTYTATVEADLAAH
jgi:hypothetical protein